MVENVFKYNSSSINVYLALFALESCIMNCGSQFHSEIARPEFIKSLLNRQKKFIRKKEFPVLRHYQDLDDYIPTLEMELQMRIMAKTFCLIQVP